MAMNAKEKSDIKAAIAESLRSKFRKYTLDGKAVMPFHTHLLGKDRMALFSFIQSLNTTFGISIYEPVAVALAADNFAQVFRGKKSSGIISQQAQEAISDIKNRLERSEADPSQEKEVAAIRRVCQAGGKVKINVRQADIYLVSHDGAHYPIDIKTAKPNVDGFEKYKENMLKWAATILYENPQAEVGPFLAIPYNPDNSGKGKYKHWTIRGMIEKGTQIKVGEEFWDFLAGKPVFDDLLDCFKEVGMEMRDEIDAYFARFRSDKKGD